VTHSRQRKVVKKGREDVENSEAAELEDEKLQVRSSDRENQVHDGNTMQQKLAID
jgi:hypothetical protein